MNLTLVDLTRMVGEYDADQDPDGPIASLIEYARERAAREALESVLPHPGCVSLAYITRGAEPMFGAWEEGHAKATFYDWTDLSQQGAYGPTPTAAYLALKEKLEAAR